MKKRIPLCEVENASGRVDVALYKIAQRILASTERERGIRVLQEHLLPLIEDAISERFSPRPLPPELMRVLRMMEANCSR